MPIFEQSYRRYEAREPPARLRFWPITREAAGGLVRRRALILLLAAAWLPLVVRILQVVFVSRVPDLARLAPIGPSLFGDFLGLQVYCALVLSVFAGAGLVAEDLRTGGILVYLSRPLTRRDYVLGKLCVVVAVNLAVTLAPALVLYLAALLLAPDQFLRLDRAWMAPALAAHSLVISLAIGLPLLAASALTRRTWVAGVGFFAMVMALGLTHVILGATVHAPQTVLLSLTGTLKILGGAVFGSNEPVAAHWSAALAVLTALGLAALAVLRVRVRAVEIVP